MCGDYNILHHLSELAYCLRTHLAVTYTDILPLSYLPLSLVLVVTLFAQTVWFSLQSYFPPGTGLPFRQSVHAHKC